ncbi:MAG: nfrB [Polaromonas sp.]|nr:nfrB [Polaromonas sp.]
MWLIDAFSLYLFGLKYLALGLAVVFLVSNLDALFIDLAYWARRAGRSFMASKRHERLETDLLYGMDEKPLAILVQAAESPGVVGKRVEHAVGALDYGSYHVFVAVLPDDGVARKELDALQARFPHVHPVPFGAAEAGQAAGLNRLLEAALRFEQQAGLKFEGFILHDLHDVFCKSELRVFNYLVGRKDLVQLPVHPLPGRWHEWTRGHYLDEFAEMHGKDVVVREALAGQVPSAGVGTCLSRRAVEVLLEKGQGTAFDAKSLNPGHDVAWRLKAYGLTEALARVHVVDAPKAAGASPARLVAVGPQFPDFFAGAVQHKARWIRGVMDQHWPPEGGTRSARLGYFRWRDRKGFMTSLANAAALLLGLQLFLVWLYTRLVPEGYEFPSLLEGDPLLRGLLMANLFLLCNRLLQRAIFVGSYYGIGQGLLAVPRLLWGAAINLCANWRASRRSPAAANAKALRPNAPALAGAAEPAKVEAAAPVKAPPKARFRSEAQPQPQPQPVAPAAASRESVKAEEPEAQAFTPPPSAPKPVTRPPARPPVKSLQQILLAQGVITQSQLAAAQESPLEGLRLGSQLVHQGLITPEQLAQALAEQGRVQWEPVNALALAPSLIAQLPARIAVHYAVLPLREEGAALILASEANLDPVSLATIGHKLSRPVRYVIAPKGQVVVGLRHWYARRRTVAGRILLDKMVALGCLPEAEADLIWREYVARQVLLGEVLQSLGHVDDPELAGMLVRHEHSGLGLGSFLVDENVITEAALEEGLQLQAHYQGSTVTLLQRAGQSSAPHPDLQEVCAA